MESKGSEGACCSPSLYFPFLLFYLSLPYSPLPFPSMEKPSVSFLSFSNFVKIFSPFLQHVVCSFTESSRKSEGQEKEALPQEADTGSLAFSYFPNFIYFLFFFPILTLSAFASADTSAKDLEPVVIKVVVESAPNV